MLQPATPLSVILFVAFCMLLLSVISTPIVKSIALATYNGIQFGVFGFCPVNGGVCSGIKIGYVPTDNGKTDFSLPGGTRHSLSTILVIHPVAAFLTLICFVLAVTSHLHSPSHSPKYLLALMGMLVPTILITLLAFLVDILLFIPHLAWGGWLVLVATILLVIGGIITCAMRRTLVSRKARKKQIEENDEMNGRNFYNRQNAVQIDAPPPLSQQPTPPMIDGNMLDDKLPSFATFDASKNRMSEDDRTPLNSQVSAVSSTNGTVMPQNSDDGLDRYSRVSARGGMGGRGGRAYNGPRDEFGNPLPPSSAFGISPGAGKNSGEHPMPHQYSNEAMIPQNFRGRGRGGYPPRGYARGGSFGPRGGPGNNGNGQGGIPLGPMAAGAGAGMMAGEMMGRGQRGPPPGYGNNYAFQDGRGQYRNESPLGIRGPGSFGRRPSPGPPSAPGYGPQYPQDPVAPGAYGYVPRERSSGPPNQRFAPGSYQSAPPGQPEPPIGHAIEMDATTGSPSPTNGFAPGQPLRDSDSDVQGFIGLQQDRALQYQHDGSTSPINAHPHESFVPVPVPVPANWTPEPNRTTTPPPLHPTPHSPVELATHNRSPNPSHNSAPHSPAHGRTSSDRYYDDIDPRFAKDDPIPAHHPSGVRSLLLPGHIEPPPAQHTVQVQPDFPERLASPESYVDVHEHEHEGTRSPAESDRSHFTSVSQRGVNPLWRPGVGPGMGGVGVGQGAGHQGYGGMGMGMGGIPNRRPVVTTQRDLVLTGNPDFEIPGARRGGGGGGGRGMGVRRGG